MESYHLQCYFCQLCVPTAPILLLLQPSMLPSRPCLSPLSLLYTLLRFQVLDPVIALQNARYSEFCQTLSCFPFVMLDFYGKKRNVDVSGECVLLVQETITLPLMSTNLPVFTVSPKRVYLGRRDPTTPASTGPL